MGDITDITSDSEGLRTLILRREKSGVKGVMGIEEAMVHPRFNGWRHDQIRQWVQQLRKKYRGTDNGEGEEFWSIYHGVIFGLTKSVPQQAARRIALRDDRKQMTVSTHLMQTHFALLSSVMHDGITHKEDIKKKLQISNKYLEDTSAASEGVIDSLVKYKEEFHETGK